MSAPLALRWQWPSPPRPQRRLPSTPAAPKGKGKNWTSECARVCWAVAGSQSWACSWLWCVHSKAVVRGRAHNGDGKGKGSTWRVRSTTRVAVQRRQRRRAKRQRRLPRNGLHEVGGVGGSAVVHDEGLPGHRRLVRDRRGIVDVQHRRSGVARVRVGRGCRHAVGDLCRRARRRRRSQRRRAPSPRAAPAGSRSPRRDRRRPPAPLPGPASAPARPSRSAPDRSRLRCWRGPWRRRGVRGAWPRVFSAVGSLRGRDCI
jgi:hypothetical protein